ncbi:MAG: hypothetical protein ACQERX_03295 [Bacillota bacterium]
MTGEKLNTFLVNNYIGFFIPNPKIKINIFHNELFTQPYNEYDTLTSDKTIYATVLFEDPYYLTIISSDDVFEDIVIQNFEEKFHTK